MPVISVRFADADLPAIRAAAERAGLSISAYVASCVPEANTLPTRGRPESRLEKVRELVANATEFRGDITVNFTDLIATGTPAWAIRLTLEKMLQIGEITVVGWRLNGQWHPNTHLPPRIGDAGNELTLRRTR